jgi:hypothetical protein
MMRLELAAHADLPSLVCHPEFAVVVDRRQLSQDLNPHEAWQADPAPGGPAEYYGVCLHRCNNYICTSAGGMANARSTRSEPYAT